MCVCVLVYGLSVALCACVPPLRASAHVERSEGTCVFVRVCVCVCMSPFQFLIRDLRNFIMSYVKTAD